MPGEELPKTENLRLYRKTSTGLSSYLPNRLEKEAQSNHLKFSLAPSVSRFKLPPCIQLPERPWIRIHVPSFQPGLGDLDRVVCP